VLRFHINSVKFRGREFDLKLRRRTSGEPLPQVAELVAARRLQAPPPHDLDLAARIYLPSSQTKNISVDPDVQWSFCTKAPVVVNITKMPFHP
jgi:hypothetical protein